MFGILFIKFLLIGFLLNIRKVDKCMFFGIWIEKKNVYVLVLGVVNILDLVLYLELWLIRIILNINI